MYLLHIRYLVRVSHLQKSFDFSLLNQFTFIGLTILAIFSSYRHNLTHLPHRLSERFKSVLMYLYPFLSLESLDRLFCQLSTYNPYSRAQATPYTALNMCYVAATAHRNCKEDKILAHSFRVKMPYEAYDHQKQWDPTPECKLPPLVSLNVHPKSCG